MFEDKTKNQHYISVSEQKLNSIDPTITNRDQIKIYSFDLVDREKHSIILSEKPVKKATKNLQYLDLYTFELLDGGQRLCFEMLFKRLEDHVSGATNKILDVREFTFNDFLNVLKAKILNMIRNPNCIDFTINNFKDLGDTYPKNPQLNEYFQKISSFDVNTEILDNFDVSEEKYRQWLKIIYLMITPLQDDKFIIDELVESFFNFDKYFHIINICKYTEDVCLLSDRGYVNLSAIFDVDEGLCFGFNLRRDAFIYLTFLPNDLEKLGKILGTSINPFMIEKLKISGVTSLQSKLEIQTFLNNMELLKGYNRHAIYQCANNVYAAKDQILI